ncbi:hypothetical protein ABW21_db0206064 [Orbilia brochopaga]|nr:hypothetical protein ABW21_db0206064 [Drechslerella brochopaga]
MDLESRCKRRRVRAEHVHFSLAGNVNETDTIFCKDTAGRGHWHMPVLFWRFRLGFGSCSKYLGQEATVIRLRNFALRISVLSPDRFNLLQADSGNGPEPCEISDPDTRPDPHNGLIRLVREKELHPLSATEPEAHQAVDPVLSPPPTDDGETARAVLMYIDNLHDVERCSDCVLRPLVAREHHRPGFFLGLEHAVARRPETRLAVPEIAGPKGGDRVVVGWAAVHLFVGL